MIEEITLGDGGSGGGGSTVYPPVSELDASPTEGGTVTGPATTNDLIARLAPAGSLSSVTFVLPNPAAPRMRQIAFIHTTESISELMVTAAPGITVNNFIADLQPGDCVAYFRISATIWARIK